jgi:transposase
LVRVIASIASFLMRRMPTEACATAHHWSRELTKLGHEVRVTPTKDVKAYVKRNKNGATDAEAIWKAVRRPTIRFVRVKSAEQQGQLMQHLTADAPTHPADQRPASIPGRVRHLRKDAKGSRNC